MKRILFALVGSWMALSATLAQDVNLRPEAVPVQIRFTYHDVSNEGAKVGDEVYASPNLVRRWGWSVVTRLQDADISVDSRTIRVGMIIHQGRPMVSLSEAARMAGAKTSWSADGKTYMIRSWVRNVEATAQGIRIDGTLPVRPKLFK
ncbi:MAG: hypothetical protein MH204_01385, partial [Fimbriimonadaceae bacterium]|nr:hypothetical protein [Fimbriimonadaceae bacterium]